MDSALSHFGSLDELIQVIYQGLVKFVVLSNVDDDKWTVLLGLVGQEGRWWQGMWSGNDIMQIVVRIPHFLTDAMVTYLTSIGTPVCNISPNICGQPAQ